MNKIFKLALLASSFFCFTIVHGRTLSVSNDPNNPAQYLEVQTAINAANAGDTLLITGTSTAYAAATAYKKLVYIGPGIKPSGANPFTAAISNLTLDSNFSGCARGSKIIGLTISSLTTAVKVNDLTIYGSNISATYSYAGNNILIANCLISYLYGNALSKNILIFNNIIRYIIYQARSSTVVSNNLFVTQNGEVFSGAQNAVITNNIFYGNAPRGASNCVFSNNLTYQTPNDTIPYGNNTGGGNLRSVNPLFVYINGQSFDFSYDYRLQPSSPAKNAGTDGTDIGPTGGFASYRERSYDGLMPVIKEFNILNGLVTPRGSLQVRIKAYKGR